MVRAEGAPTLLATIALIVTTLVAITGCSRTGVPPEPPLPQPSGAAVLGCEGRQAVAGAGEPNDADPVVADLVFHGLAAADRLATDVPTRDRQRCAVFVRAPVHVRCVTPRVSTSATPEPQQRTIALGDVTC